MVKERANHLKEVQLRAGAQRPATTGKWSLPHLHCAIIFVKIAYFATLRKQVSAITFRRDTISTRFAFFSLPLVCAAGNMMGQSAGCVIRVASWLKRNGISSGARAKQIASTCVEVRFSYLYMLERLCLYSISVQAGIKCPEDAPQ